ncbi:MAG TPA: hypothetical protein VLM36_02795 [Sphingomicrobium sp.]|jgi:hypothetical protein|nr:hypothetical protein [Sphingomicrobium sp.]
MRKFTILMSATTMIVAGAVSALATPAWAQAAPNVAEIIVYGSDPCPRSTDDQVVVCARRPEAERYRIPPKMRTSGTPQQMESWARKAESLQTVGQTGINSCSPVGPAGYTGCLTRVIQEAKGQRKQQADEETAPQQ